LKRLPAYRRGVFAVALLFFMLPCASAVCAKAPVAGPASTFTGNGSVSISDDGIANLLMVGSAPGIGDYLCFAEFELTPNADGTLTGEGVAVFLASHGDRLVGVASCTLDAGTLDHIAFSWRDSVEFLDGWQVSTSGRFIDNRPPGAESAMTQKPAPTPPPPPNSPHPVIIAIIAILIG